LANRFYSEVSYENGIPVVCFSVSGQGQGRDISKFVSLAAEQESVIAAAAAKEAMKDGGCRGGSFMLASMCSYIGNNYPLKPGQVYTELFALTVDKQKEKGLMSVLRSMLDLAMEYIQTQLRSC